MGAKESAETRKGLKLLEQPGMTVREAARRAKVAPSTLTRARKRREDAKGKP